MGVFYIYSKFRVNNIPDMMMPPLCENIKYHKEAFFMEKRKRIIIDRYYHRKILEMEEKKYRRRFKKGKDIRVGRIYRGILTREGSEIDGPLAALSYEKGIILLGKKDLKTFVFLDEDVVECHGFVYTGGQVNIIRLKERLNRLLQDKPDDTVMCLRRAASYKMFWPLSEVQAMMIVRWWEERDK
jgi:hypothetical protein